MRNVYIHEVTEDIPQLGFETGTSEFKSHILLTSATHTIFLYLVVLRITVRFSRLTA
jgi:hypothetical protein